MALPLRFVDPSHTPGLGWKRDSAPETLATGIGAIDGLIEGCPRGRITEIAGPMSSGRTTLLHAILAEAGRIGEVSAVVDACNSFDPVSAGAAGVSLGRLLVVRCGGNIEHALRTADLLVHSGGFGVIALDLCDAPDADLRRIPLSWWYRFRRAIEPTPTVLLVLGRDPVAKACSSVLVEMKRERAHFRGAYPFQYLDTARYAALRRKPVSRGVASFEARTLE